jgi:capsular polysaccharide biosynthesis protein
LATYAWLVVTSILLVAAALPWVLTRSEKPVYEADALVVARQLEMNLDALPRYGEAVFYGGAVAREAALQLRVAGDPEDLYSGPLSVITGQDSVVLTVVGRAGKATVAASLANAAASAYITELNRPGPDFGVFVLQSAAEPPGAPVKSGPSAPLGLLIGVLAGTALGLGIVGFLLAVRRPVVDSADFEETTGTPVLGVVSLPARPRDINDPRLVPGMGALVRRLTALPPGTIQVVSLPERTPQRKALVTLLGMALDRREVASSVADDSAVQQSCQSGSRWCACKRVRGPEPRLVIVDVAPTLDDEPVRVDATVLLAAEGTPQSDVRRLVSENLDADPVGVVVVRTRRQPSSRRVRVHTLRRAEGQDGGQPIPVEQVCTEDPSRT